MPMATDAWIQPNSEKSFCVAVSVSIFLWRFSYMDDGNSVSSNFFFCKSMTDKSRVPYFEA